ncbi:MAG: helix-turn-helix transcriptional regulator, partial [Acinetobacter sp.]|nr:helix-turn-helix transcriptional regulator [Acinetobacter sp.]
MSSQSERLKEARLKAGLSQKQVAEAVGMKQPSYNYLEKNDKGGSAKLPEIAKVLNVDPYWLRTGKTASDVDADLKKLLENSSVIELDS